MTGFFLIRNGPIFGGPTNLFEWNEQIIFGNRGLRGGSWVSNSSLLQSSDRNFLFFQPSESAGNGFRVAGP